MGFVHLHNHTEYSALDGAQKLDVLARRARELGQGACAITDHGSGAGWFKFAKAMRAEGLKPIIGIEAYLTAGGRDRMQTDDDWDEVPAGDDGEFDPGQTKAQQSKARTKRKFYEHLTLLAATPEGWRNLIHLVNESANSFRFKPRMDYELLAKHSEGIICLTGCLAGPVLGYAARGDIDGARANLERLVGIYGPDRTFVEIMEHGIEFESAAIPAVVELARDAGLDLVATNDAHYTHEGDACHHDHLLHLQREGFSFNGSGYHLRSEDEMLALRPEPWWREACANTAKVAELCEDVVPESDGGLPRFPMRREPHHGGIDASEFEDTPDGHAALLREAILAGAERKGMVVEGEVRDRLNREFRIVKSKGFIDYFLIVWDFLAWARANGILIGMGRGSVAGSLMAYLCEISWVDPLGNDLLFERFLEENRPDYPDMDLDFEQARRADVIAYVISKYGRDHVARIGTFQKAKSKRIVTDICRLFGIDLAVKNQIIKEIPIDGATPRSLAVLVDQPEGAPFLEKWRRGFGEHADEALETALALEGLTFGESIHACGTLISDRPLTNLIPLRADTKKQGTTDITQWEAPDIEEYKLLKMDFLGLRNLDIVAEALANIERRTGEKIDIYYGLPDPDDLDDPRVKKTYALLASGKTEGVFQLESSGMRELILRIAADSFDDLSAALALYRPGPMGANMHERYADRKNGREQIDYGIYSDDPTEQEWIATALGDTYGTFVYQEQLMNLGTVFAGFDPIWRNKLRKATAKKKKALLEEVGERWFQDYATEFADEDGNVISPVFSRVTAERMWEMMQKSSDYLFNHSHSAAYARLTYVTAYLKANYTAEYCAAVLAVTSGSDKKDKRRAAFDALRQEGIEILPPDVNRSHAKTFPIDDKTVIIGLSEIKGLGVSGDAIARCRHFSDLSRDFTSLHDLMTSVVTPDGKPLLSVSDLAGLIESGAVDELIGGHRAGAHMIHRAARDADIPVPPIEWGVVERSARQRARLGIALGVSPLIAAQREIDEWEVPWSGQRNRYSSGGAQLPPLEAIPHEDDLYFTSYGILAEWSTKAYAGGTKRRAIFSVEGVGTSLSCIMWDRGLAMLDVEPEPGQIVAISGKTRITEFSAAEPEEGSDADLDVDESEQLGQAQMTESRLELTVFDLHVMQLDESGSGDFEPAKLSFREAFAAAMSEAPDLLGDDDPGEDGEEPGDPDPEATDGGTDPSDDDPEPDPGAEAPTADPQPDPDDTDTGTQSGVADSEPQPVEDPAPQDELDDLDALIESAVLMDAPDDGIAIDDAPVSPVIPITKPQVEDGRKVPIIVRDPVAGSSCAYAEHDPGVLTRFNRDRPMLECKSFVDSGVQIELWRQRRRQREGGGMKLRYIAVVVSMAKPIDTTRLADLYDTEQGTRSPESLDDLLEPSVVNRRALRP